MAALTIPLAVISLATAVKDLVEVAQQIRDAFKQVPENYRKASEMAGEVLQFAEDIKLLYEEEKDVFERKPRFKKSVEGLLREMNNVQDQCTKLVPPRSVKKRDRFKIAFYVFWNREKVMSLVSELRILTDRCYNQFLVASNIRIEANVDRITQTVQSFSTNIASSTADTQLIRFMQSSSSSVSWMRGTISEHELRHQYINMEIGSYRKMVDTYMSKCFQTVSALKVEVGSIPCSTWELVARPLSARLEYHEQVVQKIFSARGMLHNAKPADYVEITHQAYTLACALFRCEMVHESARVAECAISAFRQASITCMISNDPFYRVAVNRRRFLLHNAAQVDKLRIRHGPGGSIELAYRGVQRAEQCFIDYCSSFSGGKLIALHSSSAITAIRDIATVHPLQLQDLLMHVAHLNHSLDHAYQITGWNDAHIRRRAIEILNILLSFYPDSEGLLDTASLYLYDSYSDNNESILSRLEYAKQCVHIYRRLLHLNGKSLRYILPLSETLLAYGLILLTLERHREYEDVLHELTRLFEEFTIYNERRLLFILHGGGRTGTSARCHSSSPKRPEIGIQCKFKI